ncbi:hypothetical protein ACFE04_011092 [Oxalis oulophora]
MSSSTSMKSSSSIITKTHLQQTLFKSPQNPIFFNHINFPKRSNFYQLSLKPMRQNRVSATVKDKGFIDEMRSVAMKLHTREQAPKEGEKEIKEPQEKGVSNWQVNIEGYLKFLVDSKLVYDTLEDIVNEAANPIYAEFQNTGLERSESLAMDLDWFRNQGYTIPEPSAPGITYAQILKELSEKDPQAFICHFYNIYFAHSAGGRMIGKMVAEKLLDGKVLEFYKWQDVNLSQSLQNVKEKLNTVAESWTREEKDHCLEETEKSFKYSGGILRLIFE